jgi:hypothetical protein
MNYDLHVNFLQRIVAGAYCLLVAYCSLWVPWRLQIVGSVNASEPVGYGWVWRGPHQLHPGKYLVQSNDPSSPVIDVLVSPLPPGVLKPDVTLIVESIFLYTLIAFVALLAVKTREHEAKL